MFRRLYSTAYRCPQKLITLVINFPNVNSTEWSPEWGGGTSLLAPINKSDTFNYYNDYGLFEDFREIHTTSYINNSCNIFVKTHNSWHCVYPINGPENKFRYSLTINIELL